LLEYGTQPTLEDLCFSLKHDEKEVVDLLIKHNAPTTGMCGDRSVQSLALEKGLQDLF
jgi:hypothetical protein